ncbi:MAG: hypothetical protein ACI8P9_005548 [Parasphingorhabdus sp.]
MDFNTTVGKIFLNPALNVLWSYQFLSSSI